MHKKIIAPLVTGSLVCFVMLSASVAHGQQISERSGYHFQIYNNPAALNKAIAIEQVDDGFGNSSYSYGTYTTNTSNSIGTMADIQATLDGDSSTVMLTATPTMSNNGTQSSDSNQSATGNGNGMNGN